MRVVLILSLCFNIVFLYYLIHDTIYYKKVIKNLQEKYFEALRDSGVEELIDLPKETVVIPKINKNK